MFAIVDIQGQQLKVSQDQFVYVNRMPQAAGEEVSLDNILLVANDGKVQVGAPYIKGASVKAKILDHLLDDKVIVFKKKRRKGYKKKQGHRQPLTKLQIQSIKA